MQLKLPVAIPATLGSRPRAAGELRQSMLGPWGESTLWAQRSPRVLTVANSEVDQVTMLGSYNIDQLWNTVLQFGSRGLRGRLANQQTDHSSARQLTSCEP